MKDKTRRFIKKMIVPVTIMCVPHTGRDSYCFKIPVAGLIFGFVLFLMGGWAVYGMTMDAINYTPAKAELVYYKGKFSELEATMDVLSRAEQEFKGLIAHNNREAVLENLQTTDSGSIDMGILKGQMENNKEVKQAITAYLANPLAIENSTPDGLPVIGKISMPYGTHIRPTGGSGDIHSGMDIAAKPSTPVRATADGIVSYSGRNGINGYVVAIEHGNGFTTFYAHNKKNAVNVGSIVKRGDIISYVGSTGSASGPHLHYEIWKDGSAVNPQLFVKGDS